MAIMAMINYLINNYFLRSIVISFITPTRYLMLFLKYYSESHSIYINSLYMESDLEIEEISIIAMSV